MTSLPSLSKAEPASFASGQRPVTEASSGEGAAEDGAYERFVNHFSSPVASTPIYLAQHLPLLYPNLHPAITLDRSFDPVAFAHSPTQVLEGTTINPLGDESAGISFDKYVPAARRKDGDGKIVRRAAFTRWEMCWKGERFLIFVINWDCINRGPTRQSFIFSPSYSTSSALHFAISAFQSALSHKDSVLVFHEGHWEPDDDLYASVQKASWEDVVLDAGLAARIQAEYSSFLRSEEVYKGLGVPWKRGLMFLGPPGNGKTISIKAIMKSSGVPSLYVKSFNHHEGDEGGIRAVFQRARREAPCLLVLEDLDSLITDRNRSFFLNELDGLEGNDGLFLIGSTNHADRLDGSLSNRPSRFDRKYTFPNPSQPERRAYACFWQKKLASNKSDVGFPDDVLDDFAEGTDGFSFAYLKEAFVSALLFLAGIDEDKQKPTFESVLLEQVHLLCASLGEKDQPAGAHASRSTSGRTRRGSSCSR